MCNKVGTENIVPRYRTITELAKESGIRLKIFTVFGLNSKMTLTPIKFLLTLWVQIARRQHNSSLTILKAGIGWNIVMSVNDRHKQQNKFWRLKS